MAFFKTTREDIKAVKERDPAARTGLEVLLCYPGVKARMWHIPAHWLYKHNLKLPARILSQITRKRTGIEIHPGAKLGKRLFIDHGMAVVIGETTEVGDDCTIYQGVTLGGTGKDCGKRHPTIGDRVIVSTGAKVLGPSSVGDDAKIGAGSVVLKEVPDGCTVVGIPGQIVKCKNKQKNEDMDVAHLPDPIASEFEDMRHQIAELESQIQTLKKQLDSKSEE